MALLMRGSMDLLGGIIGLDRAGIRKKLTDQIKQDYTPLLNLLTDEAMPAQVVRTLAVQTAQPALTYLTRIHRLEDLREGIEWFDKQVVDRVLRRCIGMKNDQVLNERVVKQASLPLRLRGIAL